MDKKYLHRVVDQIVSETEIDWDDMKDRVVTRNTIRVQSFFYEADFFHLIPDPEQNYFFNRYFVRHCKEVYGLNDDEVDYVWKEYVNSVIYKIKNNG